MGARRLFHARASVVVYAQTASHWVRECSAWGVELHQLTPTRNCFEFYLRSYKEQRVYAKQEDWFTWTPLRA